MKKLDAIIYGIELAVGCIAMTVVAALVFATVIARYIFNTGILWADEVVVNMFVVLVMMGSALCFRFGKHTEVTLFINILPRIGRMVVRVLLQITVFVFLLVFLYGGIILTKTAHGLTTSILRIPMEYIYVMIPVGVVLMLYEFIKDSVRKIRAELKPACAEEKGAL